MKRIKVYYAQRTNSQYVTGHGFVAGKPAGELVPGDTFLRPDGTRWQVDHIENRAAKSVRVYVANGGYYTYRKTTIVPIAWNDGYKDRDTARLYGHRI